MGGANAKIDQHQSFKSNLHGHEDDFARPGAGRKAYNAGCDGLDRADEEGAAWTMRKVVHHPEGVSRNATNGTHLTIISSVLANSCPGSSYAAVDGR